MTKLALVSPLAFLLFASPAAAQAPGAAPPPPADPAPTAAADHDHRTWGIGLRGTSLSLAPEGDDERENAVELGGGGIQLRYRLTRRWQLELAIEGLEGETAGLTRRSSGATFTVSYHFRPYRTWDWYLLAGFGGSTETIERPGKGEELIEETFSQGHGHLGAGLERRFGNIGIGAELRLVGAGLDPEEGDAPAYMEGAAPIPESSAGGQFNLIGTYYF